MLLRFNITFSSILLFVILLGQGLQAQAQGVGSSRGLPSSGGGNNTIQGRIYSPSGKPVETSLKIRLESPDMGGSTTTTDADGSFIFNGLPAGNYKLTVEGGTEFENAVEYPSIYISGGSGGRSLNLAIHLRLKESRDPAFASVPKDALELYKKGLKSSGSGDSKAAIEQLKGALAIYPRFVPALGELGVQYLKLVQPDKAAEVLAEALKIGPDTFLLRLNYGIALLNQKKFPEAEEQLSLALKKNSASPTAHMYLGIALISQRKLEEAEKEFQTAVSSNSAEVANAHRYLGGIYWGNRDYKRAADELETYLKLAPKAADAERTKAAIKELRSKQ